MNEAVEELSCQELVELVTDYLEDALDPESRDRFEQHLADCPHCRVYLEQMRETIRLTGPLRPDSLEPEAQRALRQAFRSWRAGA